MSTDLGQDSDSGTLISSVDELADWFVAGNKPRERWGIGLEYERLGV